jgi:hypothetical protein
VRTVPEALSRAGLYNAVRAITAARESRGPSDMPESGAVRAGNMAAVVRAVSVAVARAVSARWPITPAGRAAASPIARATARYQVSIPKAVRVLLLLRRGLQPRGVTRQMDLPPINDKVGSTESTRLHPLAYPAESATRCHFRPERGASRSRAPRGGVRCRGAPELGKHPRPIAPIASDASFRVNWTAAETE